MDVKNLYGFSYSDQPVADPKTMSRLIDELYSVPTDRLVYGDFDQSIENCIQYATSVRNREMLERLAFVLFSGPRSRKYAHDNTLKSASIALLLLFSHKSTSFKDISFVLRLCFRYWKTAMKYSNRTFYPIERTVPEHVPWVYEGIDAEDEILITHAGGYHHIQAFLQKISFGYPLEQGGIGIQVNPTMATHAKCLTYAKRSGPSDCLDTPAILIGTIQCKFLHKASNTYEAGLRSENLEHLRNIRVVKLPYLWLASKEDIEESIRRIGMVTYSTCLGLESRLSNLARLMKVNSTINEAHWRELYQSPYEEVKAMLDQTTLEKLTSLTL